MTVGLRVKVVPSMREWHPLAYQIGTVVVGGKLESLVRFGYGSDRWISNERLFGCNSGRPQQEQHRKAA